MERKTPLNESQYGKIQIYKNKDINLNVYCEGDGPLVIMAHGCQSHGSLGDTKSSF